MGAGGPRATPCFPIQPETFADSGVLLPQCGQGRVQVLGTMLMLPLLQEVTEMLRFGREAQSAGVQIHQGGWACWHGTERDGVSGAVAGGWRNMLPGPAQQRDRREEPSQERVCVRSEEAERPAGPRALTSRVESHCHMTFWNSCRDLMMLSSSWQDSRNSSKVTMPSLFLSIFWKNTSTCCRGVSSLSTGYVYFPIMS